MSYGLPGQPADGGGGLKGCNSSASKSRRNSLTLKAISVVVSAWRCAAVVMTRNACGAWPAARVSPIARKVYENCQAAYGGMNS